MRELLAALWPAAAARAGAVTFWLNPTKRSLHVPLAAVAELDASDVSELETIADGANVYFGLGARRSGLSEGQQGGKRDVIALPGLCLDVDFADPRAHKATNLPRDLDEASVLLGSLPDPSAIVHTGNGVHVYWFFSQVLSLNSTKERTRAQREYKKFQAGIIRDASDHGWHLDSTASIQRVWRAPGFLNRKTDKRVELLYCDASVRYSFEELGLRLSPEKQLADALEEEARSLKPELGPLRDALARVSPNNSFYHAIQAALKGASMANPGERDHVLQGVCSTIAWLPEGREADPKQLAEVLRSSLGVWTEEEGATKTLEEELEKAADKIERSQEDYRAKQAELLPQLAGIAKALGIDLDGEEEEHDPDFFTQHAIIQFKSIYYVYDFTTGEYAARPYQQKELLPVVRDAWADGPDRLSIYYVNDKGQTKTKTTTRLCEEYCTVALDAVADMTIETSSYDSDLRFFREAIARKRVTEPRYDQSIDDWLHALAGPSYDKVCDWIATVPRLTDQNCALYLDGYSGAGKGLLANGLARLWRESTPTPFVHVIGDFNAEIARCPLVWIDEGIPGRKGNITAELRALVGQSNFLLNEKFEPPRIVKGAIRLIICANNENVLLFGRSEMSTKDLEAVVGRILHVPARKEAVSFLQTHNRGGTLTKSWVEGNRIAMHCLHLAETRTIKPGKRFLVEGDETELHRKLLMQGETKGLVYEWLVRFATSPTQVNNTYRTKKQRPLALIGAGEICVNTQGVIDCWKLYMPDDARRPSSNTIGRALSHLAERRARLGSRDDRNWYHVIKADMVLEWCRQQQIGNEDKIQENLRRNMDIEQMEDDER